MSRMYFPVKKHTTEIVKRNVRNQTTTNRPTKSCPCARTLNMQRLGRRSFRTGLVDPGPNASCECGCLNVAAVFSSTIFDQNGLARYLRDPMATQRGHDKNDCNLFRVLNDRRRETEARKEIFLFIRLFSFWRQNTCSKIRNEIKVELMDHMPQIRRANNPWHRIVDKRMLMFSWTTGLMNNDLCWYAIRLINDSVWRNWLLFVYKCFNDVLGKLDWVCDACAM